MECRNEDVVFGLDLVSDLWIEVLNLNHIQLYWDFPLIIIENAIFMLVSDSMIQFTNGWKLYEYLKIMSILFLVYVKTNIVTKIKRRRMSQMRKTLFFKIFQKYILYSCAHSDTQTQTPVCFKILWLYWKYFNEK